MASHLFHGSLVDMHCIYINLKKEKDLDMDVDKHKKRDDGL